MAVSAVVPAVPAASQSHAGTDTMSPVPLPGDIEPASVGKAAAILAADVMPSDFVVSHKPFGDKPASLTATLLTLRVQQLESQVPDAEVSRAGRSDYD